MTDTNTITAEVDYVAVDADEVQRVLDGITRFREGIKSLKDTERAECSYQWEALLAACIDGQVAIAEFFNGMTGFIGDMWPGPISEAANQAAADATACSLAMAAVYGQATRTPQVYDPGVMRVIGETQAA